MEFDLAAPLDDATAWRLVRQEAGHVLLILDTFGVIHYVTPNAHALLGHQPDELVGRSMVDLSPTEDIERLADAHENVMQGTGIVLARRRLLAGSGRWVWVEATSRLVSDESGRWIVCAVRREPGQPDAAAWSMDQ